MANIAVHGGSRMRAPPTGAESMLRQQIYQAKTTVHIATWDVNPEMLNEIMKSYETDAASALTTAKCKQECKDTCKYIHCSKSCHST